MEYSGKVLINTRDIAPIEKILKSKVPPKGLELNKLLSFLSIYSLSEELLYDGTIPEKFLSPALDSMNFLGVRRNAKPLKTLIEKEFEELISESLNQCNDIILEAIDNYENWAPVSEIDAINFFKEINKLKNEKYYFVKKEIAYDAYNSDLLGGKLIIGLAAPINKSILNYLANLNLNETQKAKIVSAMIGTFRTFLLSNTAVKNNALYSTDNSFVKLLEKKNVKNWALLMREFNSPQNLDHQSNHDDKNWRWQFPLVGAAIILDAADPVNNLCPDELFSFSKKAHTCKQASTIQKELINRYTKASSTQDIAEQMEDLWINLIKEKSTQDPMQMFNWGLKYSIAPIIVGGVAEMASNLVFKPDTIPSWVVGSSVGMLFLIHQCYTNKVSYLNAISNLSSYNDEIDMLLESSLRKIWRVK